MLQLPRQPPAAINSVHRHMQTQHRSHPPSADLAEKKLAVAVDASLLPNRTTHSAAATASMILVLFLHLMNHSGGSTAASLAACAASALASASNDGCLSASAAAAACFAATSILPGCAASAAGLPLPLPPPPAGLDLSPPVAVVAVACPSAAGPLRVSATGLPPTSSALPRNFDTRDRLMMPMPRRLSASSEGRCAITVAAPMANTCKQVIAELDTVGGFAALSHVRANNDPCPLSCFLCVAAGNCSE